MHLVRASLRYVNAKDSKAVTASLKRIYQSATADEATAEREALEADWGGKYRAVIRLWRGNWDNIIPFFQFLRGGLDGGAKLLPLLVMPACPCLSFP